MIWVHCGDASEVNTTLSLANRLSETLTDTRILITATPDVADAFDALPAGVDFDVAPPDTQNRSRTFLEKWSPRGLIWVGGKLRSVLLRLVEERAIPATLINAQNAGIFGRSGGWMPRAGRTAVSPFQLIRTVDGATATRLIKGGVKRDIVEATGPILEEPATLPHDQYELAVMAEALETRPIWLAADVVKAEFADMTAAHVAASRKNHRLLLILNPRDYEDGPEAADQLRAAGLHVGLRSDGDDPEPEQQAYVADLPDELGLWYRLAPLTFLGGTLHPGGAASPFDPVMLGSAVMHGTYKSPHEARFERLSNAEASREVRSVPELGVAVGALISPEQTARMTFAAWEEITQNAASINALVKGCLEILEGTT